MHYILISNEHRISDRISFYLYGIGGVDENDRLIISYENISTSFELVKDLAELLNNHSQKMIISESVIKNCLDCLINY